jgi:hypothetical protein
MVSVDSIHFRKNASTTFTHAAAPARAQGQHMAETPNTKPLSGPLRARLNKLAHMRAQTHETALRAALVAQVQQARDTGQSNDQLSALVDRLEAA